MYDALTDFLKSFSVDYPVLWALTVVAVVATTSLTLYAFWELVLRRLFSNVFPTMNGRRTRE